MSKVLTQGIDHLGLAVSDLAFAERFFVDTLGWSVLGGSPTYPSLFVSDGTITLTLWRISDPDNFVPFDRRANIGLHHLALKVADHSALLDVFERVSKAQGITVEFAPGPVSAGSPKRHFICAMPDGVRLEFRSSLEAK